MPLILRWPAVLPAGRRVPETVQLIDLLPTLVDQLGLDPPAAAQGRTLVPLLEGRSSEAAAFAEGVKRGPEQRAVYLGAWKLMVTPNTNETELYDLASDPLEQSDLSGSREQVRARLARVLREQTLEVREAGASRVEPTEEGIRQLVDQLLVESWLA